MIRPDAVGGERPVKGPPLLRAARAIHKVLHECPPPSFWKEASDAAKKEGLPIAVVIDDYCVDQGSKAERNGALGACNIPRTGVSSIVQSRMTVCHFEM